MSGDASNRAGGPENGPAVAKMREGAATRSGKTGSTERGLKAERGNPRDRSVTGLSVLYAREAAEEREWAAIPDRDRTGRLREVYWARSAESKLGRKSFVSVKLNWRPDRGDIGRRRDEPGDGFIYLVDMTPEVQEQFEWLEVTEVFTTVPASQIEGAMRAWNGIPDKQGVDFDEFRNGLPRRRPSRVEQRRAADRALAQIERKLAKASYRELLDKYGYGTLVVGMPLWFAVPADEPFRPLNAVDDFMTRTALGLEDVRRRVLRRRDCPFRNVIVIWDTTPQALREWQEARWQLCTPGRRARRRRGQDLRGGHRRERAAADPRRDESLPPRTQRTASHGRTAA